MAPPFHRTKALLTSCLAAVLMVVTGRLQAQPERDQARLQDLTFVSTQLPKLHVNFFFQLNAADFSNAASALRSKIPMLTDSQFYVGLAQLAAMAGDAHTFINLNDGAAAAAGFGTFPLNFLWLDDGVFVTGAAPEYAEAIGKRLVRVGDMPIDQVVSLLGSVIPSENPQWLHYRVQGYLRGQQILQSLGIVPQSSATLLTFQDLEGHQFTRQVSPANEPLVFAPDPSQGPLSLYLASTARLVSTGQSYSFAYVSASHLLYVRYLHCQSDPGNPFPAFATAVLQTLDANSVDTLVFDLRDNTGGDSNVIDPLINGLLQRSGLLANANYRVYEIIGKGTFSSGLDNAMTLKSDAISADSQNPGLGIASRFVVIGEPTGGKPSHYGSTANFSLPASQLTGQYSTRFIVAPAGIPDTPSFEPDVPVGVHSTDFFARFDPVIAAILARSVGAAPAPSGSVIVVNAASNRSEQGLASGTIAAGFGTFAQTPDQILIGGTGGQVLYSDLSQMYFVAPASLSLGPAKVSVRAAGVEIATGQVSVMSSSPGLFRMNPADPSQPGAVENQDNSVNSEENPATVSSVVTIYATGSGPLDASGAAPVRVYLAGVPAEVLFSGPFASNLWKINVRVPTMLSGQVSLYLETENTTSNGVTIWIH